MKDLLRLRFFAPRIGLLFVLAGGSVVLSSGLRALLVWQIQHVVAPALGQPESGAPSLGGLPESPKGSSVGVKSRVKGHFGGLFRRVEGTGTAARDWWYGLFGVQEAASEASLRRRLLFAACVALFVVGAAGSLVEMVSLYLTNYIGYAVLRGVRQRLFEHLQDLPLSFFENRHSGDLLGRITNDTTVLQAMFGTPIASLLAGPPTCVAMVFIMLWLNWRLSLAVFVMMPAVIGLSVWIGAHLRRQARNVQARMADLIAFVEETLSGIRVVQAFGMEPVVDQMFEQANRRVFRTSLRTARLRALNVPVASAVMVLGVVIVLLIGGNEIIEGRMKGAGDLFTFVSAMVMLGAHVARFTKLNLLVQQAAAPCARIWEILDTPSTLTDAPEAVELMDVEGRIAFREVSFAYDEESGPVLRDVSLEVQPGEVVAIAGPSGAGKSTLANLVPRLYEVTSGAVLVDGLDVRQITRASLRRFMGIVPQETVLFATSVRENIAYGRPEADMEAIVAAAQAAQAHEFIAALPQGYDSDVGEGGVKLSGGQRQRLAIARALLRDPRILILDEATSSLDAESESAVQEAIGRLLQGRTALIIAHRLSTIRDAHRILVLDRGRIVQEGTHEQLMAAGGLYRALYETQLREESRAAKTEAEPQ